MTPATESQSSGNSGNSDSAASRTLPPSRYALYQIVESKSAAGLVHLVNDLLYAEPAQPTLTRWSCLGPPLVLPGGHYAQAVTRAVMNNLPANNDRFVFTVTCNDCTQQRSPECLRVGSCSLTGKELVKGLL